MVNNLEFYRKLPIPMEVKKEYPISEELKTVRQRQLDEMEAIFTGKDQRMILVIGPCSADSDEPVMEYIGRLRTVQDKVKDKLLIVPRIYTNKPRTTGEGYKGMLHQPDPNAAPDLYKGILAIRELHIRALRESLLHHLVGELGSADALKGGIIFDLGGIGDLSAKSVFFKDQNAFIGTSGVDRGTKPCGTAANDDDIVHNTPYFTETVA